MTERTLILIKPDGVTNGHVGEIIARIERKGLKLAALDLRVADRETAEKHYEEHADKPFFGELVSFITGGPLVAMVLEGESAVVAARQLIGATNPLEADAGSIRGEFATEVTKAATADVPSGHVELVGGAGDFLARTQG